MIFYKTTGVLFREHDPAFPRTPYRVDTSDGNSIFFDWLSEAEEHIYLTLDTSSPVSIRLIENNRLVGRWEQAA